MCLRFNKPPPPSPTPTLVGNNLLIDAGFFFFTQKKYHETVDKDGKSKYQNFVFIAGRCTLNFGQFRPYGLNGTFTEQRTTLVFFVFGDPDEIEFCGLAPIFIRGNTSSFSAEKVLKILAKYHQESVLCKQQPCRVQINASFLADLRVVALEDLDCDDNGSYEHLGTPTETFELRFENGQLESCHRIARKRVDG